MTFSKTKNNDTNEWVQWIEDGIARNYINYHDYGEFQNIVEIGSGGRGKVYRANLRISNTVVALKSLLFRYNNPMEKIVNEVYIHTYSIYETILAINIFIY